MYLLNIALTAALLLLAGCGSQEENAEQKEATTAGESAVAPHIHQVRELLKGNHFTPAIEICEKGLALDSTSVELLNLAATAYAGAGRYALAIEALERIVHLEPDFSLAYVNLGGVYTKLGDYAQAEKYLLRSLEISPDQSCVHRRLSEVYLGTDRFADAAAQIEKALEIFPEDATHYYYLGRALEGGGFQEEALAAFEKASQFDIGFSEAYYRTALLARKLRKKELATDAMKRYQHLQPIGDGDPDVPKEMKKLRAAILNAPEDSGHHFALGQLFAQHGYLDEALNKFLKAGRLAPGDANMLNKIAGSLLKHQRNQAAWNFYQLALNAQPDHFMALINSASILSLGKQHEEALVYYQKAVDAAPADPRGWYYLGLGQITAGRPKDARSSLQKGATLALTDSDSLLQQRIENLLEALAEEN